MTHFGPLLNSCQHGFASGKSIITNMAEMMTFIMEAYAEKCQVDGLYTDFSKAFDNLIHAILLQKMKDLSFNGKIIKWIASYLENRFMKVKINGHLSKPYMMKTGVPAGSILGPILFLIYINDLPSIFGNYCLVLLFADDCKLMMKIKTTDDTYRFQAEIDKLYDWCIKNRLKLNTLKCVMLTFSRGGDKIVVNYILGDNILKRVNTYRNLGITVDETLTFKPHIESLVAACNSTLGFIKRTAGNKFNTDTLVTLFNTYVKSKLMFGIVIWYPDTADDRDFIEGVQKRFTMLALREWPNANNNYSIRSYDVRRKSLNMDSIFHRYVSNCCVFIYDLITNKLKSDILINKLVWNQSERQTRNTAMIKIPTFTSNYLHNQSFWSAKDHSC